MKPTKPTPPEDSNEDEPPAEKGHCKIWVMLHLGNEEVLLSFKREAAKVALDCSKDIAVSEDVRIVDDQGKTIHLVIHKYSGGIPRGSEKWQSQVSKESETREDCRASTSNIEDSRDQKEGTRLGRRHLCGPYGQYLRRSWGQGCQEVEACGPK